ncbi:hypothetical protein [Nostoc sp.]|uniref:hypothetical protein n=1 Tax=Nostoc sp. TaxID=1180 RepID=UPI002FF642E9
MIDGNILGLGLWKDDQGYWLGQAQERPESNYLSDPSGVSLPGEPIKFVFPENNIINPNYK